jgi:predicted nuclease of predicted toxin-antitoxin system
MKLLLDQGLARSTEALLRQAGIDAIHVGNIGMATADDIALLEEGRRTGRVVVTLDADFHALMALSQAISPSVIRIRIEKLRAKAMTGLLQKTVQLCAKELEAGAWVSVQMGQTRIRKLPLIRTLSPRSRSPE